MGFAGQKTRNPKSKWADLVAVDEFRSVGLLPPSSNTRANIDSVIIIRIINHQPWAAGLL
jgi:hypothetical protein